MTSQVKYWTVVWNYDICWVATCLGPSFKVELGAEDLWWEEIVDANVKTDQDFFEVILE